MTGMVETAPDRAGGVESLRRTVPGQPDMWVLVLFEAAIFTSYFVVYMLGRAGNPALYLSSQAQLSPLTGLLNTVVLLTSSWSMARCVERARRGDHVGALRDVVLTILLGLVFTAAKLYEWSVKSGQGRTLTKDAFFSFYYFLTGIHLLHVLMGFVVLGVVVYQLSSPVRRSQEIIETGATYWHMVDFLWVVIFALLYVIR
jgi:nitric oxide reductase NorE protein